MMPERQGLIALSGRRLAREGIESGGARGGGALEAGGAGGGHFPGSGLDFAVGFEVFGGGAMRGARVQGDEGEDEVDEKEDAGGGGGPGGEVSGGWGDIWFLILYWGVKGKGDQWIPVHTLTRE